MKQLLGCFVVVFVQHAYAQSVEKAGDSVPLDSVRHLYEVTVTAHRDKGGSSIIPVQQLKGKELERLSVHSVADAMRYFADVTTMYTDNHYRQSEAYLSAAHLYRIRPWWQVSLSNDVQYNYLDADLVNFVYPTRWTLLSALSTSLHWDKLSFRMSGLQTYVNDKTRMVGGSAGSKNRFTPALILGYQPLDKRNHDLSLRAFYKRIFRMPTFNDLYYTFIGRQHWRGRLGEDSRYRLRRRWQRDRYFGVLSCQWPR